MFVGLVMELSYNQVMCSRDNAENYWQSNWQYVQMVEGKLIINKIC